MKRLTVSLDHSAPVCSPVGSACATKGYVREQVGTAETKLATRVDGQESALRIPMRPLKDTNEKTAANTMAIDTNRKDIQGLDGCRPGRHLAADAKKQAESASEAVRDTDSKLEALNTG